jgi:hypothetical protein
VGAGDVRRVGRGAAAGALAARDPRAARRSLAAGRTAIHRRRPRGPATRLAHRPSRGHGQPLSEATLIAQADPRRLRLIERQPAGRRPRVLGRRAPRSATATSATSVAAITVRIRGAAREPRNQRRDQQRRREHDQHVDQRERVRVADVRPVRHVNSVPPARPRQTGPPTGASTASDRVLVTSSDARGWRGHAPDRCGIQAEGRAARPTSADRHRPTPVP